VTDHRERVPPSVVALLDRCSFPPAGTAVTCAVSGGRDSLALLVLATAAGCDVSVVHVDHGLRPGSSAEAASVAQVAARFGAGFESVRVAVEPGPNLEARARAARYAVLPPGVLTGHTADDQAETVLLNLVRGAGLDGLAGMRPGGPVRPLIRLRRADTGGVCAAAGLVPIEDPSNLDPAIRRNRVRHEVVPLLDDVAGRDVVPVLARQAGLLAADAALLDELAAGLDPTDARKLAAAPVPLARRAIRAWLRSTGERHPPDAAAVERVLEVARGERLATEVTGGRRVSRSGGRLRVDG
jgi:tRNA(Ile)-lysidine synthase